MKEKQLSKVIVASCHPKVVEWLRPDWSYNTDTGVMEYHDQVPTPNTGRACRASSVVYAVSGTDTPRWAIPGQVAETPRTRGFGSE